MICKLFTFTYLLQFVVVQCSGVTESYIVQYSGVTE